MTKRKRDYKAEYQRRKELDLAWRACFTFPKEAKDLKLRKPTKIVLPDNMELVVNPETGLKEPRLRKQDDNS